MKSCSQCFERGFCSESCFFLFKVNHIWFFFYLTNQCCIEGWRPGRWREKDASRSRSSIWNFSGPRMTSACLTFPQVSLEMVATNTRCHQLKIFKMWIAAFILPCLSLLAVFPSHTIYFSLNATAHNFLLAHYIPYK